MLKPCTAGWYYHYRQSLTYMFSPYFLWNDLGPFRTHRCGKWGAV